MGVPFQSDSPIPLYKQLKQRLREEMGNGTYPNGSRLPSEEEICNIYGISRITVRKALKELAEEGYVERRQGLGTFVSVPSVFHEELRPISSFHEACELLGKKAKTKVEYAKNLPASSEDVRKLHLPEGSRIIEICRVRLADDTPVMLEYNRFSFGFSYLLDSDLSGSLYNLLRGYSVEPGAGTHEISLCHATEQQAAYLNIQPGAPLIYLDELIYDQKGRPLHISKQYITDSGFVLRI